MIRDIGLIMIGFSLGLGSAMAVLTVAKFLKE